MPCLLVMGQYDSISEIGGARISFCAIDVGRKGKSSGLTQFDVNIGFLREKINKGREWEKDVKETSSKCHLLSYLGD